MEEDDDVDWEDEDSEHEKGGTVFEESLTITIDSSGNVLDQPSSNKKQKCSFKRVNFSEKDYQYCLICHQKDIESQIELSKTVGLACISQRLVSLAVADVPTDIAGTSCCTAPFALIIELAKWVHRSYRIVPNSSLTTEEGRDGSNNYDLEHFVRKNKAGSSNQITQIFAALLVGFGYQVRLVRTIDPISFSPQDHPEIYEKQWRIANPGPAALLKPRKPPTATIVHTWLEVMVDEDALRAQNGAVRVQQVKSPSSSHTNSGGRGAGVIDLTDSGDESVEEQSAAAQSESITARCSHPRSFLGWSDAGAGIVSASSAAHVPSKRWVAVDVVHQRIDQPQYVEEVLRKTKPLQYVLAFEVLPARLGAAATSSSSGATSSSASSYSSLAGKTAVRIVDVTATYKLRHHYATNRDKQARAEVDVWLVSLLEAYNYGNFNETCVHTTKEPFSSSKRKCNQSQLQSDSQSQIVDLTDEVWDIDLINSPPHSPVGAGVASSSCSSSVKKTRFDTEGQNAALSSGTAGADLSIKYPMPERISDFKDHPVYLLSRFLLSEQALHPSAYAVAVFRGESVYLQVHKETLRTRLQWRRLLKQVRRDEAPVKVVQRRVRAQEGDVLGEGYAQEGSAHGGSSSSKMVEIKLFGSWQTETIQIEPVRDGILPANEYGNIEVWEGNTKFVPAGAVFLDDPAVLRTAKQLNLPCVRAVVGFERRGLQNVPIIGGVVVLKQHASILQDASFFVEAVKEETQYKKKEKELITKWARLAHGMISRQNLREKYGH